MSHYNEQRLEELRKQHAELTKEIEELESVKVWEPEGGGYVVNMDGISILEDLPEEVLQFGIGRKTQSLAIKAHHKMRVFNRLLAYVDEFAPGYEFVMGERNYYVYKGSASFSYGVDDVMDIGKVYMPKQTAIELCEKLNSGEVAL